LSLIKQYQSFELSRDLNPVKVKGMIGIILEIWEPDKIFEVEFCYEGGNNYEYEGQGTFTISIDYIVQ
jgi:hypothetical protein